eukprot:359829-Chlamydomonas_euryale.AAC.1
MFVSLYVEVLRPQFVASARYDTPHKPGGMCSCTMSDAYVGPELGLENAFMNFCASAGDSIPAAMTTCAMQWRRCRGEGVRGSSGGGRGEGKAEVAAACSGSVAAVRAAGAAAGQAEGEGLRWKKRCHGQP